ncbi:uncharacterized protein LOC124654847 [Lolium rigidum]|uniref:uncharacterized protein LOC124654847 n=1 Tax=Lolium rigidum TaxID=89674 RepID=UPI001F5D9F6E|nr:uncharacterized protein LOC124654847 [Lolium rigidum]
MDAVGARLSRSSTRYGPVGSSNASFSGTVRKWRKAWAPLAGGASVGGGGGAGSASAGMGPIGCPRGNKMVLLKWAPVNGAGAGDGNANGKEVAAAATRRRYVPALPQNPTRKSGSTELNLNLGLEDPDDDSDADLSADEQPDSSSTPRSENRLKRKVF